MAFRHGRKTAILWGDTNLSAYLNQADYNNGIDTSETTTFGLDSKTYVTGLEDAKFSFAGYYEGAVSDVTLNAALSSGSDVPISVMYEGLTQGYQAVLANGLEHTYQIAAKVSDVVAVSVDVQVDGGCDGGKIIAAATAVTGATTINNTSVDYGTGATTNGGSANLHVTANTQTSTTTIKVQHSSDNSTWVDLITFTTTSATTTTSERKTVTGTVNRYIRAQAISAGATGTLTYSLTFSRR